jgi:hypothetical protein
MLPGFKSRLGQELRSMILQGKVGNDSDSSFEENGEAKDKNVAEVEEGDKKDEETAADSSSEFADLSVLRDKMRLADSAFPPNCLSWVGASLLGSLNNEIDRFVTTDEDFKKNGNKLPDRFGDAFIFGRHTKEPFFN